MPEDPVILVGYSPRWAGEFRGIAAEIRAALGARALRIDHIGSTAVQRFRKPGLRWGEAG